MALIVIYLVLALIPAIVAGRKGRSAAGFFLLAIVLTPLISLIVALIIDPGRDHPSKKEQAAEWEADYRAKAVAKALEQPQRAAGLPVPMKSTPRD